jgi:hypothetical protein
MTLYASGVGFWEASALAIKVGRIKWLPAGADFDASKTRVFGFAF